MRLQCHIRGLKKTLAPGTGRDLGKDVIEEEHRETDGSWEMKVNYDSDADQA